MSEDKPSHGETSGCGARFYDKPLFTKKQKGGRSDQPTFFERILLLEMVTYEALFAFTMVLIALAALLLQDKKK